MSADPTIATQCTCVQMCDEPDGCCTCCGGAGQTVECAGMCWDCRGTGHPHPLEDPECPEHRITHGPPPSPTPDARSVWCPECGGPSDVVSEDVEENHYGAQFWVQRLDCGHEEVTRR